MWGRYASRRGEARYPSLWDGRVAAWCPSVTGPTGTRLYDLQFGRYQGTLTNMDPPTDWVRSSGQYALDFDGTNDRVVTTWGGITGANPRSGSAWIRVTKNGAIMAWGTNSNNARWQFGTATTASFGNTVGQIWLEIASTIRSGGPAVDDGKWHHVGYTYSSGALSTSTLYVDGIGYAATQGTLGSGTPATTGTGIVAIGFLADLTGSFFGGNIDDVAIYSRVLTAGEMRLLSRRRGIAYESRRQDFGSSGFKAYWARQRTQLIGGGLR